LAQNRFEGFFANQAIFVAVHNFHHAIEFLVGDLLAETRNDVAEIVAADGTLSIPVESVKHAQEAVAAAAFDTGVLSRVQRLDQVLKVPEGHLSVGEGLHSNVIGAA
jgi:hypothetical protein